MFSEKPVKVCKKELVSDTIAFLKSWICSCQKYLALTIYGTGALKSQRECPRKFWKFFSDDRVFIYYLLGESVSCDWKCFFYVVYSISLSFSSVVVLTWRTRHHYNVWHSGYENQILRKYCVKAWFVLQVFFKMVVFEAGFFMVVW